MLGSRRQAQHCRDLLLKSFAITSNSHYISYKAEELVNMIVVVTM